MRAFLSLGSISLVLVSLGLVVSGCNRRPEPGETTDRSRAAASAAPSATAAPSDGGLSTNEIDYLSAGIRGNLCEATACGPISCEKFSEGQSNQGKARIARCRWTDKREAKPGRCAYILYSLGDKGEVTNVLPGAPTGEETCPAEEKFKDTAKNVATYTGAIP